MNDATDSGVIELSGKEALRAKLRPAQTYRRDDPLARHHPHTARKGELPDSMRPTCSAPSADNKGCGLWKQCSLQNERGELLRAANGDGYGAGPVAIVLEANRGGVRFGEGRRFSGWCFSKLKYLNKPNGGFTLVSQDDHVYDDMNGNEEDPKVLPKYHEQGPFYYTREGQQRNETMLSKREALRRKQEDAANADHRDEMPTDGRPRRNRKRSGDSGTSGSVSGDI